MQYTLKAKKGSSILTIILGALVAIGGGAEIFMSFASDVDPVLICQGVILLVGGIAICVISYNALTKFVVFNNMSFTFSGKNYTYGQIEKIGIRGARHGRIYYEIYIDGKAIYSFTPYYDGAKEFLHYLDYYNVPGTPRSTQGADTQ